MQATFQQKLQAKLRAHQALNQMIIPSKERSSYDRELYLFHQLHQSNEGTAV